MTPELTAFVMIVLFVLGFVMVIVGGVGFMRGNLVLMDNRSRIAQGSVFALAAFMFVAGIGVHFTGSSNTAFLKGQMAQTSRCELDGEHAYPDARRGRSGIIGKYIVSCMASSGFDWTDQSQLCREAPVATNGYCYEPTAWFDRVVTQAQLAFN
jgi:hypothetical protein